MAKFTRIRFADIDVTEKNLPPIFGYRNAPLVSLEEAVNGLLSKVLGLDEQVKWAKKRCHFPSEHGLTKDESAAIYLYTMEGGVENFYEIINNALRSRDRPALKPWIPYLKLFTTAIEKLPLVRGNIWRGIRENVTNLFKRDEEFTWWSINSCSSDIDVVQQFLSTDGTLFLIEALNGRKVSGYSHIPNENEIILGPGTQLTVVGGSLISSGGLHIVHLRETNDDDRNNLELGPSPIVENKIKRTRINFTDGGFYEGDADSNNIYEGYGLLVDNQGNRKEGEYRGGKLNGKGSIEWSNGKRYVGHFKDDKHHGWGKMTFSNGRIVEGHWENNEFVDMQKYFD